MNVWSLPKHESIKLALLLLYEKLGQDSFEILEPNNSDERAILLAKPKEYTISAYLFTYGQEPGQYGVHLEMPDHASTNFSNIIEIHENLTLERLADMLSVHFDVVPSMHIGEVCYQEV